MSCCIVYDSCPISLYRITLAASTSSLKIPTSRSPVNGKQYTHCGIHKSFSLPINVVNVFMSFDSLTGASYLYKSIHNHCLQCVIQQSNYIDPLDEIKYHPFVFVKIRLLMPTLQPLTQVRSGVTQEIWLPGFTSATLIYSYN